MQPIKFDPKKNVEFINDLRQQVKEYFEINKISRFGNFNLITKSTFMIAVYLVPYFLMLTGVITSIPLMFLAWVLMGLGMAGVGMATMHDANHGSFSKYAWVNKLLSKTLYILGGFPVNWQHQHNTLHHGFTNIDGQDEDIAPIGILRFSPHKPLFKMHKYQFLYAWFFYGLMTVSWVTNKDFKQLLRYKREDVVLNTNKKYPRLFTDLIISKIIYYILFLIIPIIVIPVAWYYTLLFFLAMHFVCGFVMGVIFQTAHVMPTSVYPLPDESGKVDANWAIHQLMTTSDYAPKSRIFSWFIGGLNYQVEHHLFPNISHVHYKNIAPIVRETTKKYNVPYFVQPTFWHAVVNHAKMLQVLGQPS